jgi:ribonuclease P protein component
MREAGDFAVAVRRGVRASNSTLVAHLSIGTDGDTSVGFVVSKAVGPAVVRNRVKRRLRHLVAAHLERGLLVDLPPGSKLVVRALPASARAAGPRLGSDLDDALAGALRKAARRTGAGAAR